MNVSEYRGAALRQAETEEQRTLTILSYLLHAFTLLSEPIRRRGRDGVSAADSNAINFQSAMSYFQIVQESEAT